MNSITKRNNREQHLPGLARKAAKALKKVRIPATLIFIVTGILSTVWFLIRVIPKPSRAGYPCMKVAAPFMSSFVIYILTLTGGIMLFKKARQKLMQARYYGAMALLMAGFALVGISMMNRAERIEAAELAVDNLQANQPMGTAKGVYPGRVVWAWDEDATNENCALVDADRWWLPANTDQVVVDSMFNRAIRTLAMKPTIQEAWDTIFVYFNNKQGKGEIGYQAGEKIFIKINQGWGGWASDPANSFDFHSWVHNNDLGTVETIPQTVLSLLRQLVDEYGVPEENIYVGDPIAHIFKHTYDVLVAEYPNVKYFDRDYDTDGRTKSTGQTDKIIKYSDEGNDMPNAVSDKLYNEMFDADYIINTSALKAHKRAGVTLLAKNHFGSQFHDAADESASHLHDGLISTTYEGGDQSNAGYGKYRVLVDLLGHEHIGGKTVLNIIDGLWAAPNEVGANPVKWGMAPFNNDFPSSLFVSQDPVALESVCFDFLRTEAALNPTDFEGRPLWTGVDDHLQQAASSSNWPEGVTYDPEGDGSAIGSLGTHEHWNNETDKDYSRNLKSGNGIELIKIFGDSVMNLPEEPYIPPASIRSYQQLSFEVFPNPATSNINLSFDNAYNGTVSITVIDMAGRKLSTQSVNKTGRSFEHTLDITGLKPQQYILQVSTEEGLAGAVSFIKK